MVNVLATWLHDTGVSQAAFAEAIGAHQTQISRYVTGARKPSRRVRKAIEEATKGSVPAGSWDPPRRSKAASSRRAA